MEMGDVFNTQHAKWLHMAAKVWLEDGSKQVCRLKQTYTPIGADRKNFTIITDVFLLNCAVSLDQACDGSQNNTWGVWPCKLPIDNLPRSAVAGKLSPALMSGVSAQRLTWVYNLADTFRLRFQGSRMGKRYYSNIFTQRNSLPL